MFMYRFRLVARRASGRVACASQRQVRFWRACPGHRSAGRARGADRTVMRSCAFAVLRATPARDALRGRARPQARSPAGCKTAQFRSIVSPPAGAHSIRAAVLVQKHPFPIASCNGLQIVVGIGDGVASRAVADFEIEDVFPAAIDELMRFRIPSFLPVRPVSASMISCMQGLSSPVSHGFYHSARRWHELAHEAGNVGDYALLGANMMIAIPSSATKDPTASQTLGLIPSMSHSHSIATKT